MELNSSSATSTSPSFRSDSNATHTAERVIQEFRGGGSEEEEFNFASEHEDYTDQSSGHVDDEGADEEFEFHFQVVETENPLKTADEIFQNGLIRTVYQFPDPYLNPGQNQNIRVSLRKLFMEERDHQTTTSLSSEDDDGVPPESYCVWRPGAALRKKSGSMGSGSKKWKLTDVLANYRSRSDGGKGSLVFPCDGSGKTAAYGGEVKRRTTMSYLPYREDLAGMFRNKF